MKVQPPRGQQDEIRFTQNFLRDPALVSMLVNRATIKSDETILEIGPGKGIITRALARAVGAAGQVIAVELDASLAGRLTTEFISYPQVKIIAGDILSFKRESLPSPYKVFANVPFNITSPLLEYLFDGNAGPVTANLILQVESLFGIGEGGVTLETFKSLLIKPLYTIEIAHRFQRSDFTPPPAVDTALFAFGRRTTPLIELAKYSLYKEFLAYVSKDRVGEGVWLRVMSRQQINRVAAQDGLVFGRGIKMQSASAMAAAFRSFAAGSKGKHEIVYGAMAALRAEQARHDNLNRAGGHRRPRRTTN